MEVDNINKKYKNKARENLANNILSLRYEKNLTQEKLAELLHSSAVYISNIEHGKKSVSIDFLDKLAELFDIPSYELLLDKPKVIRRKRIDSKK